MKTTILKKEEKQNQVEGCAAPLITPATIQFLKSTTNGGKSKTETKADRKGGKTKITVRNGPLRKLRVQTKT